MSYINHEAWDNLMKAVEMQNVGKFEEMKIDKVDTESSLFKAFELINNALMEDANYEHLTKESKVILNRSLADLSQMIVQAIGSPRFIISKD